MNKKMIGLIGIMLLIVMSIYVYADTVITDTDINCINVIASGNVTADNIFEKADIFVHADSSQSVTSAGTWYNVTFTHESDIKQRITHTYNDATNDTITIVDDGVYDFKYAGDFNDTNANPDDYAYMRVIVNGVEIHGSGVQSYLSKQYAHIIVSGCARAELNSGDEIKLQFTSSSTDTNLETQNGYFDHADSARMCLIRIR